MKTIFALPVRRTVIAALTFFAIFASSSVWADESELGVNVGTLVVPDNLSKDDVKETIAYSLASRGWSVKTKTSSRIVGYLKHRGNEATLTFLYNKEKIDLHCVGWQINKKTGEHQKPELPDGWIGNIKKDITKRLNQRSALK